MICRYCCHGYIADGFDVRPARNAAAAASSIAAKASGQIDARSIRGEPRARPSNCAATVPRLEKRQDNDE